MAAVRGLVLEVDEGDTVVRTLSAGARVAEGGIVRATTGASATLVLANGGVITVQPETDLQLEQMQLDGDASLGSYEPLRPAAANTRTRLRLDRGEVLGEVKGIRANSKFEVVTAVGTAGITGTQFRVALTLNPDGTFTLLITNIEGSVVATLEGQAPVAVPPGSQATITGSYDSATGTLANVSTATSEVPADTLEAFAESISSEIEAARESPPVQDAPSIQIPLEASDSEDAQAVQSAQINAVIGTAT